MPRGKKKTVAVNVNDVKPVRAEADDVAIQAARFSINSDTKNWIRNAADERAAAAGMVFDGERGEFVCNWMETRCYLFQGQGAGQPIKLVPYQREFVMRLYSWVFRSVEWGDWIRRFRLASLFCAKKNGKSPFLSANGLYLLTADGEAGQNVYTTAKNGTQAARTQEHAVAMVEQSPDLHRECVIHKGTQRISHPETRSKMVILCGDDTRGAQANEGINGSVLIDEVHVVDREMWERTKGAGISRKEPINLAVSTAGDDPSSYGFERCEYGRQVNAGTRADPHFLHVEYSAPQHAKDEDIAANLEEYGKAANPAWGILVHPSEFKSDYETSKDKPREMARFKQYRLDIWVGSTTPWLDVGNWAKNRRDYGPDIFKGREVSLGIDLSRTRDMTNVTIFARFPEEGENCVKIYPLFWIPRKIAEARRHLFPYMDWYNDGELNLTEGNVVDYTAVEEDTVSLIEENEMVVTDIYFDQHYAEELTQRLVERLECNRTAVTQSLMTLSPLCKEFERLIDSGNIHHPGNAVMDWQAGHVQVWRDRNQNIRYVKPDPNSGKSVDGIAGTVNAMLGFVGQLGGSNEPDVYF